MNRGPSALRCGSGVCFEKGMKKPMIDIAVLGLGTVGNGVYEVIAGNGPHIARSLGGEALRINACWTCAPLTRTRCAAW